MSQDKFTAFSFDATQVQPAKPLEPIPGNYYPTVISDGEIKPTADGTGLRMNLEFQVVDGEYKGRKYYDGLNIQNNSPQAQEIAQQQLSAICYAVGVLRLTDVQELFNKPFISKVGYEPQRADESTGKVYDARNVFKGAKPLENSAANTAQTQTSQTVPSWASKGSGAAPATGQTQPAQPAAPANPANAGGPTSPPPNVPPPAAAPAMVKQLVMTPKASGMSKEDFVKADSNWTDELLVREGYAEFKEVPAQAPTPPATPAAPTAPPASGGPVAPPWAR